METRDPCPNCGYSGPKYVMFEVPSHHEFGGRILHVATMEAVPGTVIRHGRYEHSGHSQFIHTLCGRAIHKGHIYGGSDHGYRPYDTKRVGLCKQCQRKADR
jgi:hypothetical protein